jgi:hypothetical protein
MKPNGANDRPDRKMTMLIHGCLRHFDQDRRLGPALESARSVEKILIASMLSIDMEMNRIPIGKAV